MPKRAASLPRGAARKKTNADPVGPKIRDVVSAINKANAFPDTCKEMLSGMVASSLSVFASERHAYQTQGVKMLGEAVEAVHKQMQGSLVEAQAKVNSADQEKAARAAAVDSAQKSHDDLDQRAGAAKAAADADKSSLASARANVVSAAAAVKDKDCESAATVDLKTKAEAALKEVVEPAKTTKANAKAAHMLEKVLRDTGLEDGLLEVVPDTFKKDADERGTFDGLVFKSTEEHVVKYIAKAEKDISSDEQTKANLANAKTAADAALADAEAKVAASSTALQAAEAALKDGKAAVKTAHAAVSGFDREMVAAASHLEDAKSALTSFTEGAQASFAALKVLAPPPEPEPVPEVVAAPVVDAPAPAPQNEAM